MKKILFAMLMLLTMGMSGFAQTLTVAEGTQTNEYVPIYGYYADAYLMSQTIYPASMLTSMNGESILSLTFYLSQMPTSNWGVNFQVRLKEVTDASFATEDFLSTAASDVVYTGNMDPVGGMIEITLENSYTYNGGNLLLEVRSLNTGSYSHGYFYGVSATNASVQGYDYSSASDVYPEYQNFIPKTTFGYGAAPTCGKVKNLAVSNVTGATATLSWNTNPLGTPSMYYIEIYDVLAGTSNTESTTDTTYLLTGLTESTAYMVGVYTACTDGNTSDTSFVNFMTTCLSPVDITIGDGSGTTGYFPSYSLYNYSYTQQIIPSTSIGSDPMNFTAISFNCSSVSTPNRTLEIYAAMVPASANLSNGWITPTPTMPFQLIYSGGVTFSTGWVEIPLDAPLVYDGSSNLLISVRDMTGSWSSTNYFYCHSDASTTDMSRYAYRDDSPYDQSNPDASGYVSSNVNNIRLGFCDNSTCIRPVNLAVSNIDETFADLNWVAVGTENMWEVEYRASTDTGWTNVGTTSSFPYTLTGLNSNTAYIVHVRAVCGGGDVSLWSEMVNFRTSCGAIAQLPYSENFEDAGSLYSTSQDNYIVCWDRYASDPAHYVYIPSNSYAHSGTHFLDFHHTNNCYNIAIMPELDASFNLSDLMVSFYACRSGNTGSLQVGVMTDNEDPTTFVAVDSIDLSAAGTYEYVEQHVSFENYTGGGTYVAFRVSNAQNCGFYIDDVTLEERPVCMYPSALTISNVGDDDVTLTWVEVGNSTSWTIEYGAPGFTPGEGAGNVISGVTTIPYTVDNLAHATTYDFYVQSDCGSDWTGPVTTTTSQYIMGTTGSDTLTTCGLIIYDNGGPDGNYSSSCNFTLVLYPENPNAVMALIGTSSTESCCDYLRVYDGAGTSGSMLAEYKGENLTVNVMSQSGPLTLVFYSDGSVVKSGFALTSICVTCYPPTNITSSNPTLDGATLNWHGTGDSYVLFLNGDMTTGYDANDTTYTFSGLNPSSTYSVQIAAICNGDTSMLSSVATFATGCGAFTITADNPWVEDFESYPGSGVQQFLCWERPVTEVVDNGTAPFVYCNYGQAAHSGTNTAEMKGTVNMLALPEFTNNLSDLRVSFWATGYSYTNTNVEVGYITDVTDPTTFVPVHTNAGVPGPRGGAGGGNGNYMGPFSFSGVSVSNARIALRYTGPGSSSGWNVDDFIVELAPDCQSPLKSSVTATNIGGHVATITWVDNDPNHSAWTVYYKASSENDWSTVPANDTTVQLTGLDPLTAYDVYVITNCGTPEANPDATHTIHFTTTVACPAPANLTLSNISTDEATITWNGTASSYNVEYGETGFTPGTGITDVAYTESYTLTNLTPSTSYTIYVNSDCLDNNDGLSSTVSFSLTTTQVPAALPYTADFTVANEWLMNNGTCSSYWITGSDNNVPSLFVTNNGSTPGYNTSSTTIVSAEKLLAVGDNASVVISFDVRVGGESSWDYLKVFFAPAEASYPAATSAPDFASYSYSTYAMNFENYLSQTGSSSYPYKLNLTQGNTLHVTAEMPNPNINATSNSTAKLVFMWKNDSSGGTQPGPVISNVSVLVNSCPMPSNMVVNNVTSNSADLTWTAGDSETEWEVEYGTAGFAHGAGTVDPVSGTPSITLSNLTPATAYDVYVRAICSAGDSSAWVGPVTVVPGAYIMPSSGNNTITGCDLVIYDDGGINGNYSNYCESYLTINPEDPSSLVSIQGTLTTESCCDYLRIYDGADASGTMFGEYKGSGVVIPELISTTGPITLYFHSDGSLNYEGFVLTVGCVSNTCPAPTNFTVSNVGLNSADLSWTAGGSESAWVVEYKEANASNWTVIPVTTTTYQLTGLTALTSYMVRVKADCGGGDESTYKNASFTTPNCNASDACQFTFVITDGYGDGWNGGYLTVEQNGTAVATIEATDNNDTPSTETVTVSLCDNVSTSLVWHIGEYDDEVGITLNGPDGTQLFTIYDLEDITSYTLFTFTTDCSGSGPGPVFTDPTVATNDATSIAQTSATLNATITNPDNVTITAKGFEWKATTGGTYTQVTGSGSGNTFSYNLGNLTPSTSYTFKAFITFNGQTVYGGEKTFTTLDQGVEPCDVPTGLTASDIQGDAITITWDNNAGVSSWNIQYRPEGGQLSTASSTTNSYTITGLVANTTYQIQVQANCGDNNLSDWSPAINVTTTGIESWLANSVTLFPNPANEYVDIRVDGDLNVSMMEVYDVYGKLINTVNVVDNPTRINVSGLANGMYFVRVTTEKGTVTKSFLKK